MARRTTPVAAAAVAMTAVAVLAGSSCSSDDSVRDRAAEQSSTGVTRAGSSEAERIAVIRLCQQVITSTGAMVRDYNAFIEKLNDTQDYDRIGAEDRWAVETLQTGAEMIRTAVAPDVPGDIDAQVQAYVTSSERLAELIEDEARRGLNRTSDDWSDRRSTLLDTCSGYLPAGS
ncbi:hypothetical protein [Gordonia shandongensis]|uniref:hypothetical protein n=1 Tax=Gordonia shandongensis TaxID=376351 RepID=UPI00041A6095|nr:hypothetical protein [Gordonia shandongensis]